jgi:hypothetical protein
MIRSSSVFALSFPGSVASPTAAITATPWNLGDAQDATLGAEIAESAPEKATGLALERATRDAPVTPVTETIFDLLTRQPTPYPAKAALLLQREAGNGRILENLLLGSCGGGCGITNIWIKQTNEDLVYVEAEAQFNIITNPRRAILFVQSYSRADGTLTHGAGFRTPIAADSFMIVDAVGDQLLLRTQNGTPLVFDVAAQQYISPTAASVGLQRSLAQGMVVENGDAPFSQPGFHAWNRWSGSFNGQQMTLYAGGQDVAGGQAGEQTGRIALVASSGAPTAADTPQFFDVPNFRRRARVFDVKSNLVALVSAGEWAVFDLQARRFVPPDDPSVKVFLAPDPFASLPTPLPPTPPGTLQPLQP